jgi:ankyrin repeat protein
VKKSPAIDRVSAIWIACTIGSESIIHHILSLRGQIRDDECPDGTTAFVTAVAKNNDNIVRMLLESRLQPKNEMIALYAASINLRNTPYNFIDQE